MAAGEDRSPQEEKSSYHAAPRGRPGPEPLKVRIELVLVDGPEGKQLPKLTINRAWQRARREVFTPQVAASPLARTPYDLRHAAVSTWLNGGVASTDVAAWAGHSMEILHKIYAKCLDGGGEVLRQRVQTALGHHPSKRGQGQQR